jgi:N6-L-threonylcarbamoyladenine synthase
MIVLAFESSCDETAVAVVENGRRVLADEVLSQVPIHAEFGGVVPEIASRQHIQAIAALSDRALAKAGIGKRDVDAVAVTYAPGLIGAVLVGLNFAKSAAYGLGVPLIPVHHLRGHIAANYLAFPELEPPFVALCMSGGNTLILHVRSYTEMEILGATRDDAAGECLDKAGRVLGLPYPAGKPMDELAQKSDGGVYALPRAKIADAPLDMSFSGLKTAVVNLAHNAEQKGEAIDKEALARDILRAIEEEIVPRAMQAVAQTGCTTLVAAGGVAANSFLRRALRERCAETGTKLYLPPLSLCGDNAAMIGAQGYYEYLAGHCADWSLNAYATMAVSREGWRKEENRNEP